LCANRLATDCEIKTIGAIDCSKAQRENRAQVRDSESACSAPASFPFLGRGDPLLLLLFKAMLFGGAGKSGRPPSLEPSLKVQRDIVHNQSSGFAVAPRVKGLNARGPSKVHPKWCLRGISAGTPVRRRRSAGPSQPSTPGLTRGTWRGPHNLRKSLPAKGATIGMQGGRYGCDGCYVYVSLQGAPRAHQRPQSTSARGCLMQALKARDLEPYRRVHSRSQLLHGSSEPAKLSTWQSLIA
jgi:hypothetical protein